VGVVGASGSLSLTCLVSSRRRAIYWCSLGAILEPSGGLLVGVFAVFLGLCSMPFGVPSVFGWVLDILLVNLGPLLGRIGSFLRPLVGLFRPLGRLLAWWWWRARSNSIGSRGVCEDCPEILSPYSHSSRGVGAYVGGLLRRLSACLAIFRYRTLLYFLGFCVKSGRRCE
jgi:hypothetical protein